MLITCLVYYLGGASSPFSLLYLIVIAVASTLLRRRSSSATAVSATAVSIATHPTLTDDQRATLLVAAFATGSRYAFPEALADRLHQPFQSGPGERAVPTTRPEPKQGFHRPNLGQFPHLMPEGSRIAAVRVVEVFDGAVPGRGMQLQALELGFFSGQQTGQLMSRVIRNQVQPMSANVGFASAVAEIGMLLRDSPYAPSASFDAAIARARKFRGADDDGYRMEFIKLAEGAASLKRLQQVTPH